MRYYWIRKEDLRGQEVIDEVDINDKDSFVKVRETRGAVFYHEEVARPAKTQELQTAQ